MPSVLFYNVEKPKNQKRPCRSGQTFDWYCRFVDWGVKEVFPGEVQTIVQLKHTQSVIHYANP